MRSNRNGCCLSCKYIVKYLHALVHLSTSSKGQLQAPTHLGPNRHRGTFVKGSAYGVRYGRTRTDVESFYRQFPQCIRNERDSDRSSLLQRRPSPNVEEAHQTYLHGDANFWRDFHRHLSSVASEED